MTIQKIQMQFGDKAYNVILEDGIVFYIDPAEPLKELPQPTSAKVTSLEDAKRLVLQAVKRIMRPA